MEIKGGSVGSRNNLSRLYSFKTTCLPSARPPAEPQRAERRLWKRLYAGDLWFKCLSRCHSQIIMRPHTDFGLNKETKKTLNDEILYRKRQSSDKHPIRLLFGQLPFCERKLPETFLTSFCCLQSHGAECPHYFSSPLLQQHLTWLPHTFGLSWE